MRQADDLLRSIHEKDEELRVKEGELKAKDDELKAKEHELQMLRQKVVAIAAASSSGGGLMREFKWKGDFELPVPRSHL